MGNNREGYVSLWHPWKDKTGSYHSLSLWKNGTIEDRMGTWDVPSVEHILEVVGRQKMFCFCNDILDATEFEHSTELIRHPKTRAFPTKSGGIVALKVRHKRSIGYFIPASVWGLAQGMPTKEFLGEVQFIHKLFNHEALSPASLSEKVLRSTLPDNTYISRPSAMMRKTLLDNGRGGRIDTPEHPMFYRALWEYDKNKAYLDFSGYVPSPYHAPLAFVGNRDIFNRYACSFVHCTMTVHGTGLHPIQIKEGEDEHRKPRDGETITVWAWDEEIRDCLEKGYTLHTIHGGYGWKDMSSFMQEWRDILWQKYQDYPLPIIKTMMVGVPGRFLRRPEILTLVHKDDRQWGDVPVLANWGDDKRTGTEWLLRTEYDLESAQLTQVGSYIIMKCRQEMYRVMREEIKRGNTVVRSYIDCVSLTQPTKQPEILGTGLGMYKEKKLTDVWVEENGMQSIEKTVLPGYKEESVFRKKKIEEYKKRIDENRLEVRV